MQSAWRTVATVGRVGNMTCWRWNREDRASPLAGPLSSVGGGVSHVCTTRADRCATCFGPYVSELATRSGVLRPTRITRWNPRPTQLGTLCRVHLAWCGPARLGLGECKSRSWQRIEICAGTLPPMTVPGIESDPAGTSCRRDGTARQCRRALGNLQSIPPRAMVIGT